jgi:hypothetical protein
MQKVVGSNPIIRFFAKNPLQTGGSFAQPALLDRPYVSSRANAEPTVSLGELGELRLEGQVQR